MDKYEMNMKVYEAMGDSISKDMYRNRIDYSNGINEAMESIILSLGGGAENNRVYAGKRGRFIYIRCGSSRGGYD